MGFVELQPHQIVFLQCQGQRLYAEVIQTVPDRRLCWARPLVLLELMGDEEPFPLSGSPAQSPAMTDLRQASDLLLPLSWFQTAVDTEVMPILAQLVEPKTETSSAPREAALSTTHLSRLSVQEQLQQFIRNLCQTDQQPEPSD